MGRLARNPSACFGTGARGMLASTPFLALLALGAVAGAPASFDPSGSDPRAVALANQVMQALGGEAAWAGTHYLRFAFAVEKNGRVVAHRTHLWDRWAGRLRYENVDKSGAPIVVLLDLKSRQGEAYGGGARLDPQSAKPLLDEAYEAWINDTYWLLMPYKMKDPGVHLKTAGEAAIGGETYDRVLLTFDKVGLTPGDRYWAYINRRTHLMDRWAYILEDDPPKGPAAIWDWKGWKRFGSILLCPEKVAVGKGRDSVRIVHPVLEVLASVPEASFARPDPLPARLGPQRS